MSHSLTGNLLVASSLVHDPILSKAVCLLVQQDENGFIGVMLNRPLQPNPQAMMQMLGQSGPSSGSNPSSGASHHDDSPRPNHHRFPDVSRPEEDMNELNDASLFDESIWEDDFDDDLEDDLHDAPNAGMPEQTSISESAVEKALASATQSLGTVHFGGPLSGPVVAIHGSSAFAEAETGRGIYLAAQKRNLEGLVSQSNDPYRLIVGHLGWEADQLQAEFDAGYWHMIPATTDAVFAQDQEMWPRLIRRATANSVARWIGTPDVPMAYEVN